MRRGLSHWVRDARPAAGRDQASVYKVGAAIIGGDQGGDHRGENAIDLQASHASPDQVASGDNAVVFGRDNKVSASGGIALGYLNTVDGVAGMAVGKTNRAGPGPVPVVLGQSSEATGMACVAIGMQARAHVDYTVNLGGALIVKRAEENYSGEWMGHYAGAEVYLFTDVLNMKAVADYGYTLPAGCHFLVSELGIICAARTGITVQPTVRFGQNAAGQEASLLAAVRTTNLTAAGKRQRYAPLLPDDALASLSFGVTVAATGTSMSGRAYFRGLLVEDED